MSSVTRFIRQIPSSASHLNAAALVAGSVAGGASSLAFELVPSSGNIVGNYPPGYVQKSAALDAAIAAASAAASGAVLLRDMGKTILAPVGSLSGAQQYYRQVQLIAPAALSSGFVGNFGVLGAANTPTANVDYLSFYIPVSVAGVGAAINAYPVAAGQM